MRGRACGQQLADCVERVEDKARRPRLEATRNRGQHRTGDGLRRGARVVYGKRDALHDGGACSPHGFEFVVHVAAQLREGGAQERAELLCAATCRRQRVLGASAAALAR